MLPVLFPDRNLSPLFLAHSFTVTPYIMPSRLDQLTNSFSRFGARLWNSLPDNIRKSDSRKLFKKQIHEKLINIFLKKENTYLTPSSILEIMKSL